MPQRAGEDCHVMRKRYETCFKANGQHMQNDWNSCCTSPYASYNSVFELMFIMS